MLLSKLKIEILFWDQFDRNFEPQPCTAYYMFGGSPNDFNKSIDDIKANIYSIICNCVKNETIPAGMSRGVLDLKPMRLFKGILTQSQCDWCYERGINPILVPPDQDKIVIWGTKYFNEQGKIHRIRILHQELYVREEPLEYDIIDESVHDVGNLVVDEKQQTAVSDEELITKLAKLVKFGWNEDKQECIFCWTKSEYPKNSNLHGALYNYIGQGDTAQLWNPLSSDTDCFRMIMDLNLQVWLDKDILYINYTKHSMPKLDYAVFRRLVAEYVYFSKQNN